MILVTFWIMSSKGYIIMSLVGRAIVVGKFVYGRMMVRGIFVIILNMHMKILLKNTKD